MDLTDQFVIDFQELERKFERLQSELEITGQRSDADADHQWQTKYEQLQAGHQTLEQELEQTRRELAEFKSIQKSEADLSTSLNSVQRELDLANKRITEQTRSLETCERDRKAAEREKAELSEKFRKLEESSRTKSNSPPATFEDAFPVKAKELRELNELVQELQNRAENKVFESSSKRSFEVDYPDQATELNNLQTLVWEYQRRFGML